MGTRSTVSLDVATLYRMWERGQLNLAPEFQRTTVWPRNAKAYLVDSILMDRPIPSLMFQRVVSAQTAEQEYRVIDGQQRVLAVIEFLDDRFPLIESDSESRWHRKYFSSLSDRDKDQILRYSFLVDQLAGYSSADVLDVFVRINRFVVPLTKQELRHAASSGAFHDFVAEIGGWDFWVHKKVISKSGQLRRRTEEFAAELAILLMDGPQNGRQSVDFYYSAFQDHFEQGNEIRDRLERYLNYIDEALPLLPTLPLRRPATVYALIGALDQIAAKRGRLPSTGTAERSLTWLADQLAVDHSYDPMIEEYQTGLRISPDSIRSRWLRIDVLRRLLDSRE